MARDPLPIDPLLPEIADRLRSHGALVLSAETGAGKTTRVPPALLDAGLAGPRRLVMLEPRRLAARAAARRIAQERGVALGDEVGYHVRFERRAGPRTRLLVVTEGILVRMLQDDPFLEEVGLVVFDEFHERSLDADLSLALVERVRRDARPDLRVAVMSATLDTERLSKFLGGAPVVVAPGRQFEVLVEYEPIKRDDRLEAKVAAVAGELLARSDGDLLVFLPGVGEIARCAAALAPLSPARDVELVELHGELPPERQDAALTRGTRRRIVLATNVAETSVTLPGVTAVLDSGLVRRMRFDPASGLDRLELGSVSKASAEQRRGRAGRVAPGMCIRLWSALDQRGRPDHEEPEIRRVDLAGVALQLLAFGERDVANFPFFEAPEPRSLARGLELLERLGATRGGALTEVGRELAKLPVHPRLARLLHEARRLGIVRRGALAAALLAERDAFLRAPRRPPASHGPQAGRRARHDSDSDLVDRVAALEEFSASGSVVSAAGELEPARARFVLRGAAQLEQLAGGGGGRAPDSAGDSDAALRRALFVAFADRLVRRREAGSRRGLMAGGRGVELAEESAVARAGLFVAIDVDDGGGSGGDARVRAASAVERDWLDEEFGKEIVTADELFYDAARDLVVARRTTRFHDLPVDERPIAPADRDAVARTLAEAAARDVARALDLDHEATGFAARVQSLAQWMPELEWPRIDDDFWCGLLPELCAGCRSFAELRRLPLADHARGRLTVAQRRALERDAPERIRVPSGSEIRLDYRPGQPPALAVRMQELFGLAETPRVAGGRVPVVLHLLGPNHRPQQVTQDLASFWSNVYPKIRGELRARYPRHAWPDDPRTAAAVRGPRRKR
jgi:ATP-dependent RNA helicase HrpB